MTPSTSAGFELVLRDPAPGLRGLVRGYGGFRERASGPVRRRELPTTDVVVILDLGRGWRVSDCADPHGPGERHGSFVAGLDDRAVAVEHDGDAHCVQVDLTPLGARALLGASLPELARRVVALEDVIGAEASSLVERLHAARDWEARFTLLDAALAARGRGARYPRPDTAWAWRRLEQSHGALAIGTLAAELGCSRRHLSARFREEFGLSPKRLARVMRFRRAAALLRGGGGQRLAEIAAECGYFDQAHFNRDFRAFSGVTPGELVAGLLPGGAGVAA